jgi:hypothetical protein
VATKTKAARAKTRAESKDRLTDIAVDAMHSRHRDWSIDTLLTWPRKARSLAAEVAGRLNVPCTEEFEHRVLRSLLNSRKHGDLRRDPV